MKIWGKNKGVWWCENSVWHVSSFIQPFCNTAIITLSLWGLHLACWMDCAYHIMGNQRHVPSCEKPHLSNSLTHFSSLLAPRGSRRCWTSLTGVVRPCLHSFSRRLKICRKAKRDWHNFKDLLIRLSKSSECPVYSSEYGYPLASAKFG